MVSRSGEVDSSWAGSVLLRDLADVRRLRQEDGPRLLTQGSPELVHALLSHGLVDAMSLFTVPVVIGGGKRLFVDGAAPHAFRLVRSRVSPTGVMVGHYEREGEVKTGVPLPDAPASASWPAGSARSARGDRAGFPAPGWERRGCSASERAANGVIPSPWPL